MIRTKMLKIILATAMLIAPRAIRAQTIGEAASSGPVESDTIASVMVQGLRMRSFPGTEGYIIASFSKGDTLRVATRTSWNDSINGIRSPWYEVSKGWAAGWCFGGYLSLPDDKQIPLNSITKGFSLPLHSYFENADGTKVGKLPYLNMTITGIEEPIDIPSRDGFNAHYDLLNRYVLLEVDKPPNGPIQIRATDPKGTIFNGKPAYHVYSENAKGHKYISSVIGFTFRAPANTYPGMWKLELSQGRAILKRYLLSIPTATATLSNSPRPDPFDYPFTVDAHQGDTLFLFACNEKPNSSLIVAFYRINYERLTPLNMNPHSAALVRINGKGRLKTKFIVGMDMPSGSYKLAVGSKKLAINLFDVLMNIP